MDLAADHDTRVQLEVWSDVACPWCFIGRRNLGVALDDLDPRERPAVTWRAYQLDPEVPLDGVNSDRYFLARFGTTARIEELHQRVRSAGGEVGIEFRFDRQRVVPNTLHAHRLVAAAAREDAAEDVVESLFSAYFERGVDIGNPHLLRELAHEALGSQLGELVADAAEQDPRLAARVAEDLDTARQMGIAGVPCFVADRRTAVPGAVPPLVLATFLAEATTMREADDEDEDET